MTRMVKMTRILIILLIFLIAMAPISTVSMDRPENNSSVDTGVEPEEGETPVPEWVINVPKCIPVKEGDKDAEGSDDIKKIQQRLIDLNYLSGTADGAYGSQSANAVCRFQEVSGLQVYGIVDVETYAALFSANAVPQPEPTPTPISRGASGEEVKLIQEKLTLWGFMVKQADGEYGSSTYEAVKNFQEYVQENDINLHLQEMPELVAQGAAPTPTPEPTPIIVMTDPENPDSTAQVYFQLPTDPTPTPKVEANGLVDDDMMEYLKSAPFDVYVQDLGVGDRGAETRRVQRRLVNLGYLDEDSVSGKYGNVTSLAISYFQYLSGLSETGVADEATQLKLFSESAPRSDVEVYSHYSIVDISDQRVYIYKWNGRNYNTLEKTFICSTGKEDTPTPLGTYHTSGPTTGDIWHYFVEFDCYALYATRIYRGILFHSVTFSQMDESTIHKGALKNLGKRASHGCVRLTVEDSKWIYENCSPGMTVVIRD